MGHAPGAAGGAASPMGDAQLLAVLEHDETWHVERVLASKEGVTTELVTPAGVGGHPPRYVRKRIRSGLANREAWEAVRHVDHPLVPRVRDIYELPDELVCVCDYVEGTSLADVVSEGGAMAPLTACRVAGDVAAAASALHEAGVVHRDITPANVIVARDGAHLTDLGIARVANGAAAHDTRTLGTPGFAAPEQFGFAETDARADVYAIGRLLGFMLTGELPGPAGTSHEEDRLRRMSPELAAVVARATAFDRSDRYQTASELAEALDAAADAMRPVRPVRPVREPAPAAGATTSDGPHSGPSPSLWRAFWKGLVGPALAASWGELAEGRRATHGWRRWLAECFVWAGLVVSGFVAVVAVVDATAPDPLRASTPIAGFVAVGLSIALINVDGAVLEVPAAILGVGCHREAPSAASRLVACVARLLRMLAVWYLAVFLMALAFAALGIW